MIHQHILNLKTTYYNVLSKKTTRLIVPTPSVLIFYIFLETYLDKANQSVTQLLIVYQNAFILNYTFLFETSSFGPFLI